MFDKLSNTLKDKLPIHLSLIDPEKCQTPEQRQSVLELLGQVQTDAILVGGSSNLNVVTISELFKKFKKLNMPIISFLRDASEVCPFADGAFAPMVMNSRKPWFLIDNFFNCIDNIEKAGIELITLAYIVQRGKTSASFVVDPISIYPKDSILDRYARVINALDFKFAYLEAGSGADKTIDVKLIKGLKRRLKAPLLVGGGIVEPEQVNRILKVGADGIVTGTLLEKGRVEQLKKIIQAVKNFK